MQTELPSGQFVFVKLWRLAYREWIVLLALSLISVVLATTNLRHYPTISGWDEGMYLQFASNLAYHGEYATRNGPTFERLEPVGGTGPTLVAPVAVALRLGGHDLMAARMPIVIYLLIALTGAYLLLRQFGGPLAALAGLPLVLTAGYQEFDTLWMGRQVLAELPSLAFLFVGLWAWSRSWRGERRWLWVSGLLFALAVITKNQLIWVLGPAFVLFGLADRLYYHQLQWRDCVVPLAAIVFGYGLWMLLSLWIVGSAAQSRYLELQSALTTATFLHIGFNRSYANLRLLLESGQAVVALLAVGWCFIQARPRSLAGLQRLLLPLLASVVLLNFLVLSLPWVRYVYPVLVLASLCTALSVADLAQRVARYRQASRQTAPMMVLFAVSLLAGPRLFESVQRIAAAHDSSAEHFSSLITLHVPEQAEVLSWEWELEFYTQRPFVHPSHRLFAALIEQTYNQYDDPILQQPRIPPTSEYLVIGPFARQTSVFDAELAELRHQLLANEGAYSLYQLYR